MSKKKYVDLDKAVDIGYLGDWYQSSIDTTVPPVWTDEHLEELCKDFIVIPKDTALANAEEVRHGKWIIKNNELHWQDKDYYSLFITCSECGLTHFLGTTRYANEYNEQKFKDNNYDKYLFCGNCGAKMDKE